MANILLILLAVFIFLVILPFTITKRIASRRFAKAEVDRVVPLFPPRQTRASARRDP